MKLSKNKILITGATSGIGEALLNKFIELDNEVIIVGRNRDKLDYLEQKHKQVISFYCDLSINEERQALVQFVNEDHADLNILINNAGIQINYNFISESPNDTITKEITTNLIAPIALTSDFLPTLNKQKESAVVNISSALALAPKMDALVYCATKAAIHNFTKGLRIEQSNILFFEIIPPLVDTNMTKGRGAGKISPEKLVDTFIKAFQKNRLNIYIGKSNLLKVINWLSPKLATKIINR